MKREQRKEKDKTNSYELFLNKNDSMTNQNRRFWFDRFFSLFSLLSSLFTQILKNALMGRFLVFVYSSAHEFSEKAFGGHQSGVDGFDFVEGGQDAHDLLVTGDVLGDVAQ